jgi:oligo-alginate lyase
MGRTKKILGVEALRVSGRTTCLGLLLCLLAWTATRLHAAEERIVYAPDVVGVERMFMIALKVPADSPDVTVTMPDGVALFHRTRLPTQSEIRRFYFRAVKPAAKAEIRFALPGDQAVVPSEIWSFEDLRRSRTLKGVPLPRRWPPGQPLPELKEKQTYPTGAEAKQPRTAARGGWLDRSDDEIWAMQPDSTIPRWHWTNIQYGCPVHGTEIYRKAPYYPWIMDGSLPWKWKIRCPVGGEEYPSNDFAHGDMTSGAFPDDGIGGGCLHQGKKYGFLAELSQFYCRRMMSVAPDCARQYVATGDVQYVHKTLVALCRLAAEYAYLATMTQHRHRNTVAQVERFGQGRFAEGPCLGSSGFTTYCIEQPGNLYDHAEAYDRVFPAIEKDGQIIPFLQTKGFEVKSHEDVRRFIEENLFAVWMQGVMDGACASNEPAEQRALVHAATILNYARGADFMDWLYDGEGMMRSFVTNGYFRDGAPFESTGGYNGAHVTYLAPVVDDIERLRQLRPDAYPESTYPSLSRSRRYHNIFDFCMDTVTIDRSLPYIGDGGSWPCYSKLSKITWHDADAAAFEHAYRLFRDPKFAWALTHSPAWNPSSNFPLTRDEAQREAAQWPDDWNDRSSLHDGYGIAILRSGQGDQKRALWMKYGQARSHTQDDLMDIGLQGHQGILLTHMGYPRNWGCWEPSWTSHHVARQIPFPAMSAHIELFAEAGPVRLAEARAGAYVDRVEQGQGYELPPQVWQRRTIALVDVAPDRFYGVDLYRISGGEEHWWAFHAQEGEFATQGIELAKLAGTLAGPNVPYGDADWLKSHGCSYGTYGWRGPLFAFPHLYNVQRGRADGVWSADWKFKTGDGIHLRMTIATTPAAEVNICDGRSPAGGSPYEMKWIMLHTQDAAPARTQVLGVLEPYLSAPAIRSVRPLTVSGLDEQGFAAAGCEVQLADRTDTLLVSADPGVPRTVAGSWTFAGRFGFYSERDGIPVAMSLVGGTQLAKGRYGITLDRPEYRAKIVAVDRHMEAITVAPPPPDLAAIVGANVFLCNPDRQIAYRVLEAKPVAGGALLRLSGDSRIATGRCRGVTDHRVLTSTPLPLQRFRYYHGARLTTADRSAEYRIVDARSKAAVFINAAAHPDATAAALAGQFPKDTWFDIYDYGVGDEIRWPYAVSVTLTGPGQYRLTAPIPVQVRLPDGAKLVSKNNSAIGL